MELYTGQELSLDSQAFKKYGSKNTHGVRSGDRVGLRPEDHEFSSGQRKTLVRE